MQDPYRKKVKPKPVLYILRFRETDESGPYYVEVSKEKDDIYYYAINCPEKATAFTYGEAEMFRMKEGRGNFKTLPRAEHCRKLKQQQVAISGINYFWRNTKTEHSVPEIEPRIEVREVPNIFKKKRVNPFARHEP